MPQKGSMAQARGERKASVLLLLYASPIAPLFTGFKTFLNSFLTILRQN
jgi:hypothetical protein